ncbi:dirigent protein 2-like protein [Cinnamomum micranthum f. kanehirae]|uniref:Dirigent protein n=1 Tax=Cinnamomum micranthum f. kanehirae TaxID=337451 RepID=A0A443P6D5_9MAGN|nr:dirigent protein 2-like protein [Cinnamomum micranthum f. kanehirae]
MASITLVKIAVLLVLITTTVDSSEARSMRMKEKKTKMVFYMQDWETGKNVTAVPVAGKNGTLSSILNFATVMVVDDAITEGQDRQSKQIGRAQGIYVNSALDASDLHLLFSIVFTNKKYNGSTIEIQGADRFFLKQREVSVVSGTGYFRFAQGFAVLETVYLDLANLNAVIKFNIGADTDLETEMVFYMQDWESGKNITAVPVSGRNGTLSSVLNFATVMVVDDAITEGQDRQSKQIGRAQGIYVNSALDASDLHLLFSIVFTNEKYNGSTIEIQGADRFFLKQREVSVVSGTGYFRFAKGFAVLETVYLDLTNLNAVIRFNITVHHY